MTRHRLRTSGTGINVSAEFVDPDIDGADIEGLPGPPGWDEWGRAPRWITRLESLSRHANATEKLFLISQGVEDSDHLDKGGNRNLWKDLRGSARWALAHEGWHVYEMFKPDHASGTDGGPFHLFLMDVFEFATGLDPEVHSKLIHSVKMVCPANRRYSDHMNEIRKLEAEERKFKQTPSITPEEYFEIVGRKRLALEKKRLELWQALYPHNYRRTPSGQ
jgi:hypothetical protein